MLDVNQAGLEELLLLPGINLREAQQIIKQREKLRPFISKEDFLDFLLDLGIKPHWREQIRERIIFTSALPQKGRILDF